MSLDIYLECEHCGQRYYDANITHNLNNMADAARIYQILWRPDENGIEHASQLIKPLTDAIDDMKHNKEKYEKFDSPNGWGTYEDFVPWLERLLENCIKYPNAKIRVWR